MVPSHGHSIFHFRSVLFFLLMCRFVDNPSSLSVSVAFSTTIHIF